MITSPPARDHARTGAGSLAASDARDAAVRSVLAATRSLLWVEDAQDVADLAAGLVAALGGTVVPARGAGADAVPIDLSFGTGEPALPLVTGSPQTRALVEHHLPGFVRDAHRALELADRPKRLAEDASIDALTGLANRRTLGRVLGRLRRQDVVIMLDLDHFKAVNDTLGHVEGDRVLREFGAALKRTTRATDRAGRYGGEEFVVVLAGGDPEAFLQRLREEWEAGRTHPVTFSAGIAPACPDTVHALRAADRALYRAKQAGRDRWQLASDEDYR